MVSSYDFVPRMWDRYWLDKNENETSLNDALLNGGREVDPVQEQLDYWEQENYHSASAEFGPWMRAMQIMENRLRIEFASHALRYKSCEEGRCAIIYDLKEVGKLVGYSR